MLHPAVLNAALSGLEAEGFQARRLLGQWMGLGQGQPDFSSSPLLNLLNLIIWGRLFAFLPRPFLFTPNLLYCNGNFARTLEMVKQMLIVIFASNVSQINHCCPLQAAGNSYSLDMLS